MSDIDKLNIYLSYKSSSKTDYRDRNDKFFDNTFINSISQSIKTSSMANFNMLQLSFFLLPSGYDPFFLTSVIERELASTRNNSTKVKKVKSVY